MNASPIALIAADALSTAFLLSCDEAPPTPSVTAESPQSEASDYPRLLQTYPKGSDVSFSSYSISFGENKKLWTLLKSNFETQLEGIDARGDSSYEIQRDGQHSLAIVIRPGEGDEPPVLIAEWSSLEDEGSTTVARKQSPPLEDPAQALALLKAYLELDPSFETMTTWTVVGRSMPGPGS